MKKTRRARKEEQKAEKARMLEERKRMRAVAKDIRLQELRFCAGGGKNHPASRSTTEKDPCNDVARE